MSENQGAQARQAVQSTFDALANEEYDLLLETLEYRVYSDGDYLAKQGEVGQEAYLIMGGDVEVIMHRDGATRLLGTPTVGEIVGEMAVLEQQPRIADMRAKGRVSVLVFDRSFLAHARHAGPIYGRYAGKNSRTGDGQPEVGRSQQQSSPASGGAFSQAGRG